MEETAQRDEEFPEKVRVATQEALGQPVQSVKPETENPLEIAEEMLDIGGEKEGNAPSKSFLGRKVARLKEILSRKDPAL